MPEGVVFARVDWKTGRLAARSGARADWQAFVAGTEPVRTAAVRKVQRVSARRALMLDAF
jgi:hypothetical protein